MTDDRSEDETEPMAAETDVEVTLIVPAAAYESVVTETSAPVAPVITETTEAEDTVPASAESRPEFGSDLIFERISERFDRRFNELKALFDREIRAEATREKVVDRLHAELQEYKQDLLLNTLRPVFIDLIQLHDDIGKVALAPIGPGGDDVSRLVGLMQGFQQGIEDILYRQGVEPFEVEGEVFDPRRQRAVATVSSEDPALNKTVAARLRKGYRSGDRVIRAEIVSVYSVKK